MNQHHDYVAIIQMTKIKLCDLIRKKIDQNGKSPNLSSNYVIRHSMRFVDDIRFPQIGLAVTQLGLATQ